MCVMDGPASVQVTPSPKALRLALCLKIALFFQLSVVVCLVLAHRYVDAGVGVLGVIFGLACVGFNSADDGFALQTVLCYTAFACVMLFWGMSRAVFHFIGKEAPTAAALAGWQASVYQAAVIADVAVYFCVFMLSYMLYSELRRILDDVANLARILTSPDALAAYAALPITEEAAADREAEARASLTAAAAGGADATAIPNKQRAYTGDSYKLKV